MGDLGSVLGGLGAVLGGLGAVLERSWAILVRSWAVLGRSWTVFGGLGSVWGGLGVSSEEVWGLFRGPLNIKKQRRAQSSKETLEQQKVLAKSSKEKQRETDKEKQKLRAGKRNRQLCFSTCGALPVPCSDRFPGGSWRPPGGSFARGKQAKSPLRPLVLLLCALGAFCGCLGRSWGGLGVVLGGLGAVLAALRPLLGCS